MAAPARTYGLFLRENVAMSAVCNRYLQYRDLLHRSSTVMCGMRVMKVGNDGTSAVSYKSLYEKTR